MKIQTRSCFSEILRELTVASRQIEDLPNLFDRFPHDKPAHIRPDQQPVILRFLHNCLDTRVLLVSDMDIMIPFIIHQQNVVFWAVVLNQRAFQHQRLEFT